MKKHTLYQPRSLFFHMTGGKHALIEPHGTQHIHLNNYTWHNCNAREKFQLKSETIHLSDSCTKSTFINRQGLINQTVKD